MRASGRACARSATDTLFIADEVVTGFGRTGFECGSRAWGVKPDLICTAKPITGGYFPLGAVMINTSIAAAFERNTGLMGSIGHGYTYSGHPVGCAAGLAALKLTRELRVWENARARGEELLAGLRRLQQKHAGVGDVRGKGLMAALEIVADRKSKAPADKRTMDRILAGAIAAGAMVRARDNCIILLPPLIFETGHVEELLGALDAGLARA
jgi:putrescine---pyruvate transaminase